MFWSVLALHGLPPLLQSCCWWLLFVISHFQAHDYGDTVACELLARRNELVANCDREGPTLRNSSTFHKHPSRLWCPQSCNVISMIVSRQALSSRFQNDNFLRSWNSSRYNFLSSYRNLCFERVTFSFNQPCLPSVPSVFSTVGSCRMYIVHVSYRAHLPRRSVRSLHEWCFLPLSGAVFQKYSDQIQSLQKQSFRTTGLRWMPTMVRVKDKTNPKDINNKPLLFLTRSCHERVTPVSQSHIGKLMFPKLISYMSERRLYGERWTKCLSHSSVPLRLIFGPYDPGNTHTHLYGNCQSESAGSTWKGMVDGQCSLCWIVGWSISPFWYAFHMLILIRFPHAVMATVSGRHMLEAISTFLDEPLDKEDDGCKRIFALDDSIGHYPQVEDPDKCVSVVGHERGFIFTLGQHLIVKDELLCVLSVGALYFYLIFLLSHWQRHSNVVWWSW